MGSYRGKKKLDQLYKSKKFAVKGRNLWSEDGLATNLCESLDPCFSSTPSLGALHPQILNEFLDGSRVSTHQSPMSFLDHSGVILSGRQFFPLLGSPMTPFFLLVGFPRRTDVLLDHRLSSRLVGWQSGPCRNISGFVPKGALTARAATLLLPFQILLGPTCLMHFITWSLILMLDMGSVIPRVSIWIMVIIRRSQGLILQAW